MAGTHDGGKRAAVTNKLKYDDLHPGGFYKYIGQLGGAKSKGGGFAQNPELARTAGAKGGKVSRRTKKPDQFPEGWGE